MGKIKSSLMILAIGVGLSSMPARADGTQQKLNGGYYLLHSLGDDESQLPILLDLKHAPQEVIAFADQVSKTGKATEAALEDFQDGDKLIRLDQNPLPAIEQDVRDSIKKDKQHQLLFGTKNDEFVRALMVSQIEASAYGANLCKVLAGDETSPARAEKLRKLGAQWRDRHDEAFRILRNY
jgi:hypothetical protein